MEEYLTTLELSQRIKMAPGTIRNLVWKGVFKENVHYLKPTPKKLLFVWSEIREWLYQNPSEPAGASSSNDQARSLINI